MGIIKNVVAGLFLSITLANAGVYEDLNFGDSKQQVKDKLIACKRIETTLQESIFDTSDLNATFQVKQQLKTLKFSLHFNWNENDQLTSINLRSSGVNPENFDTDLKDGFNSALDLINEVYQMPAMENSFPKISQITEGKSLISHLWHPNQGTLIMGIDKIEGKFHLSIRFLQKRINP